MSDFTNGANAPIASNQGGNGVGGAAPSAPAVEETRRQEMQLPPLEAAAYKPPAQEQPHASVNVDARDSSADVAAARAAVSDPVPMATDNLATSTRPVIQPPTSDMRSEAATTAPSTAFDTPPPFAANGAQPLAMTSEAASAPEAVPAPPQPVAPPTGTGNPYDAKEEAEMASDAPPQAAAAPSAEAAAPSAEAVAPKNETVLSPVDVGGQAAAAAPAAAPPAPVTTSIAAEAPQPTQPTAQPPVHGSAAESTAQPVQSSIAEPPSQIGVGAQAQPTSSGLNGSSEAKVEEPSAQDAVMADGTVSSSVAPAVAGMGGVSGASASDEPPMKKLKTSPSATPAPHTPVPASAAPAAAQPPAPTAQPSAPTDASQHGAVTADPSTISMTSAQIKFAQNSIKSLKQRPEAPAFLQPVDPIALNIPQYRQIIERPMDLGTIDVKLAMTASALKGGKPTEKTKTAEQLGLNLSRDVYKTVQEWESDVRLVFANCIRFNGPDHAISQGAKALEAVFEKQLNSMPAEGAASTDVAMAGPTAGSPARRPSNPVPTIRRSSSDNAAGRPKREIHPPPPRDLHYEEQASSGRKRKGSKAMTPKQAAYWAKVNADELKFCLKVTEELSKQHYELSWVFVDLPDRALAFAPAYYATIKQPISLTMIAERLRKRDYEDKDEFVADMRLLFQNCYTFNPPEEDVHKMGQKLEAIFNEKMRKLPKPKVMTPEIEDEEDGYGEEDLEEEDRQRAEKIRELEEQLAELKRQAKAAKARQAGKKKTSRPSGAAGGGASKKSGGGGGGGSKKASSSVDGAPKKPKQSKKAKAAGGDESDDDDDVRAVSWEQKEELARKITQLSDERLDGALQIISEDKPPNANDDEEIELDIEDLSPRTLYKLYRYVVKPKKKPGPKPGTAKSGGGGGNSGKSGKAATGGKKRKNLDEEAEAARIARLQEQLQSFDRAPDAAGASAVSAAPAGHDDLVQSESSSGEEDSDGSDSDY